ARSFANLQDRDQALRYVELAEEHAQPTPDAAVSSESEQSEILVFTGEALNTVGDQRGAMERFQKALALADSNRINVRLAIAQLMAQQGHSEDAQRQI